MPDIRIVLAALWIAVMLVYLLGDVLRIFSGDFVPGEMDGQKATQAMWFAAAVLMLIPILMVLANVLLDHSLSRPANIIAAGFLLIFNLVSVRSYPSAYDRFLLVVSMVFNAMTIWYAWHWAA